MTLPAPRARFARPVDVERILARADAQLRRLEAAELARLREVVNRAYQSLAAEVRRRWPAALQDAAGQSRTFAEARARALLEQIEAYVDALDLGAARTGVPQAMRTLIQQGHAHGLATATTLLDAFGAASGLATATATIDWRAVEAAAGNAAARLTAASEAAQARIRQHVVEALVRGEGNAKVARRIRETLRGDGRTPDGGLWARAQTIARTELATAKAEASEARYREAGVEMVQWFATEDERTCPYCAARHGNVYKLGEVTVPGHPACRCFLAPFRREFVEAGLVDVEWWRESQEEIERIVPNLNRGASPFEKANGRPAPRPVWTPQSGWRPQA